MPFYVYRCSHCGNIEERFRRVEDRDKVYRCSKTYFGRPNQNSMDFADDGLCLGIMQFVPFPKTQRVNIIINSPGKQYAS